MAQRGCRYDLWGEVSRAVDTDYQPRRGHSIKPLLRFLAATAPFHIAFDRTLRGTHRPASALRQREAENTANGTGQELAAQLDSLFDLVLRVNRRGRIGEVRGPLANTISNPPDALIGMHAGQAVPELGRPLAPAVELAFAGERAEPFTYDGVRAGVTCHFEARVVPWSTDQAFVLVRDVTEQRQLELQLARQAFEDRLTGSATGRCSTHARSRRSPAAINGSSLRC